jgi:hypothetical protein
MNEAMAMITRARLTTSLGGWPKTRRAGALLVEV